LCNIIIFTEKTQNKKHKIMLRKLTMAELNRISVDEYQQQQSNIVVVLDNIRSMHNVGSTFRTADSFGVGEVFLCGITAQPPHREIEKTALGATESVKWTHETDTVLCLEKLKMAGYNLVAIEQTTNSTALQNFDFDSTQKYALVFGNEVFGVSDEAIAICQAAIEIPQSGTKHSLNISVCVGVVLWQYLQKTQLAIT
jgi:23S rRNA (guanosine2251-2'-O)-methyltransferase